MEFNLIFVLFSAQNKSENSNKTGTRALGNQVIRKGHMCIQNLGIMKGMNLGFTLELFSFHFFFSFVELVPPKHFWLAFILCYKESVERSFFFGWLIDRSGISYFTNY